MAEPLWLDALFDAFAGNSCQLRTHVPQQKPSFDYLVGPTKHVSAQLGIERWQLREAIHKIKARSNLGAQNRVNIHDDGAVTDEHGEYIGNIFDEI